MSLFARVFSILLAFSLAPLFALATWVLRSDEAIRENVRAFHRQAAEQAVSALEQLTAELNRELAFVAELDRLRSSGPLEEFKALQAAAANPRFMLLSVVGADGREYLRTADEAVFSSEYADRSQEPAVLAARKSGRATFGEVVLAKSVPVLPLAYPIAGDRLVYVGYSLESAWRRLEGQKVGRSGRVLAASGRGTLFPGLPAPAGLDAEALKPLLRGERGVIDHPAWVGGFERAPSLEWYLVSLQPRSEAFLRSGTFHLRFLLGVLGVAVIAVLASAFVTRRLTAPLEALIEGASRVGRSELDRPVPETGWGKLRDLAQGFNEMTAKLKAYQDLQLDKILAEKAKVETLVETMPDGVALSSLRGELEYINRPAAEVLQLTPEGGGDRALHELISPAGFKEAFARVLQRGRNAEVIRLRRGTETRYYRSQVAMSKVKGQQEVAVLALFQDITAERELDLLKEETFHGIVHDLRNPLTAIIGFIELAESRGAWTEQGKKFVPIIKQALNSLEQLIDDILQLAKLETGGARLTLKTVSAADLIEAVRSVFSIKAETEKKTLAADPVDPALALECDRELLERAVMNLTGNALKFTPKNGTITLRARRAPAAEGSGEAVVFGVSDTGPGIPKEQAEAIFERFKQLEGEQKKSGFGLGLSICKRVVELHGGRIWVESTLGVGTTFLFEVPCRQAAAKAA